MLGGAQGNMFVMMLAIIDLFVCLFHLNKESKIKISMAIVVF